MLCPRPKLVFRQRHPQPVPGAKILKRITGEPSARLGQGTDEHGIKVQQAAVAVNLEPSDFCTAVSQQFRTMFDTMAISYTDFVRTTEFRHAQAVCHFWKKLEEKGYIYKGTYQGWYCTSDEAFLSEDQTVERRDGENNKIRVSADSGHQVLEKQWGRFIKTCAEKKLTRCPKQPIIFHGPSDWLLWSPG